MKATLTRDQPVLTCEAARLLGAAAARRATKMGLQVSVCVVDPFGAAVFFLKMDGAMRHTATIAQEKAATAAAFGRGTTDLQKMLAQGSPEVMEAVRRRPGVSLLGGGEPIEYRGRIVGGIGVSGGMEEQDRECAHSAIRRAGFGGDGQPGRNRVRKSRQGMDSSDVTDTMVNSMIKEDRA